MGLFNKIKNMFKDKEIQTTENESNKEVISSDKCDTSTQKVEITKYEKGLTKTRTSFVSFN